MKDEVVPFNALEGRLEFKGDAAESVNVFNPPSIEKDDVRGLRFVAGLRLGVPEDPFVPFPFEFPPIGIGSEPPSPPLCPFPVVFVVVPFVAPPPAPPSASFPCLLPIDMPNPVPLASPSLTGNRTDTTASFEE